ncbi:MAG: hypothetical protein ACTHLO_09245 [Pseudolabrys sp.]
MSDTEQYLIETADKCARLARLGREIAADLEAMSNDLLAKAVTIDTARDRERTTSKKSSRS